MHEFTLVRRILQTCIKAATRNNASKITEIRLILGDFTLVVERLMNQAFKIATKGTMAEGAEIIMVRKSGVILCNECGEKSEVWFENAWERGDSQAQESLDQYKETMTAQSALSGMPGFGKNIFQCPHCESRDTALIDGKKIIIKNIRV